MSANDELQAHTCEKMLEFYGDVANNVAQPEMQDLTEQWKKGEIEGEYYIETTNGKIYNVEFQNLISVKKKKLLKVKSYKGYVHKKTVKEVLAPVPSYEEWLENESHCAVYSDVNKVLKEENQQLKELLKEWMHFYPIILYEHEDTLKTKDIVELYEKTREVLKCKK